MSPHDYFKEKEAQTNLLNLRWIGPRKTRDKEKKQQPTLCPHILFWHSICRHAQRACSLSYHKMNFLGSSARSDKHLRVYQLFPTNIGENNQNSNLCGVFRLLLSQRYVKKECEGVVFCCLLQLLRIGFVGFAKAEQLQVIVQLLLGQIGVV